MCYKQAFLNDANLISECTQFVKINQAYTYIMCIVLSMFNASIKGNF